MTSAMGEGIGISKQRGFWLRCFLEFGFLNPRIFVPFFVLISIASFPCSQGLAQTSWGIVDCIQQKTLEVRKAEGQVFDPSGVPVPKALVWLSQDGKLVNKLESDSSGRFEFNVRSGRYTLRANLQGFETTTVDLNIGKDIASLVHPTALKVILALPGMNCPWVTTSNREYKELVQRHATQK